MSLAVKYTPAVKALVWNIPRPSTIDYEDLVQIGVEQLVILEQKYDKTKNDNFWGYAKTRVRGSILDYFRKLDNLSRRDRKKIKDYELGKGKVSEVEYNHLLKKDRDTKSVSIDDVYEFHLGDDYNVDISDVLYYESLLSKIKEYLNGCDKRDKEIYTLHILREIPMSEVAEMHNITSSRVCQICKKINKDLRGLL